MAGSRKYQVVVNDNIMASRDLVPQIINHLNLKELFRIRSVSTFWNTAAEPIIHKKLSDPDHLIDLVLKLKPNSIFQLLESFFRPFGQSTSFQALKQLAEENPSLHALIAFSIVTNDLTTFNYAALDQFNSEVETLAVEKEQLSEWWEGKIESIIENQPQENELIPSFRSYSLKDSYHYGEFLTSLTPEEHAQFLTLRKITFLIDTYQCLDFLRENDSSINLHRLSVARIHYFNCSNVTVNYEKDVDEDETQATCIGINFENANFDQISDPTSFIKFDQCELKGSTLNPSACKLKL